MDVMLEEDGLQGDVAWLERARRVCSGESCLVSERGLH